MRTKQIHADLEHRRGCPKIRIVRGEQQDPRETYTVNRPDGTSATVTRCLVCAAETVDGIQVV